MRAKQFEKAQNHFQDALKGSPGTADYHYWLAQAFGQLATRAGILKQASLAGKTRTALERAIVLDANHLEARLALIDFYKLAPGFMGGSGEKALLQAREIRKRDPMKGAQAFAKIHLYDKKPELAKKEYLDAVRAAPESVEAHYRLATFLLNREKNLSASLAELEAALRINPGFMPAQYFVARIAAEGTGSLVKGEELLRKYLAYNPKDDEPPHARAYYWLGMIYEKQGKTPQAKQAYSTSLKMDPEVKEVMAAVKRVEVR